MRLARRTRFEEPAENPAQSSSFPAARADPAGRRLTETNVARTVPPGIATYFLKRRPRRPIERVGRDDVTCGRLIGHAREAVENVLFGGRASDARAYRLECFLWHAWGPSPSKETRRRPPSGSRFWAAAATEARQGRPP
jgi:hypothetical protein